MTDHRSKHTFITMTDIIKTDEPLKPIKLKPKQKLTISNWLNPESETFGNLYQSAIKAGFARSYALNLTHLKPSWLSETLDQQVLEPEHLKQGVQKLATGKIDSRSVDDTRLKAFELLGRWAGMDNNNSGTTVNIVTPILGGDSTKTSDYIDITETSTQEKKPEK